MKKVDVYFQSANESPGHVNNVMCRMSGYHCILVIWVDGEMWFIFYWFKCKHSEKSPEKFRSYKIITTLRPFSLLSLACLYFLHVLTMKSVSK